MHHGNMEIDVSMKNNLDHNLNRRENESQAMAPQQLREEDIADFEKWGGGTIVQNVPIH
jgi:hypothetical protein